MLKNNIKNFFLVKYVGFTSFNCCILFVQTRSHEQDVIKMLSSYFEFTKNNFSFILKDLALQEQADREESSSCSSRGLMQESLVQSPN